MTPRFRRSADDLGDRGFMMVEVIVAMAVFAVLVSSSLGLVVKTGQGASDNRARVVAAGCGATQIEAARGTSPTTLVAEALRTYTCAVGPVTYTVTRTTARINPTLGSSTTCGSASAQLEQVRVNVSVTWPNMGNTLPVRSDTLLAAATRGSIEVTVLGDDGTPQPNMVLTLSNGTALTTGAAGCRVFDQLTPGTYTVSVTKGGGSGYVGPQGQTTVVGTATVTVGAVTRVTLVYAVGGTFQFVPRNVDGSADLNAAWQAKIPTVFRTTTTANSIASRSAALPGTLTGLYPGVYKVSDSTCPVASVSSGDVPGDTVVVPVKFSQFNLTLPALSSSYGDIVASAEAGGSCPEGTTLKVGYMPVQNFCLPVCNYPFSVALPAGPWIFRWSVAFGNLVVTCGELTAVQGNGAVLDLTGFLLKGIPFWYVCA